ncbi:hypothetical protein AW14_12230 [Siansivirga zeaxanthinifaciens CC-SAMT-1]|uniref:C1q domain-containing protein n=2 Tax=Siansivirga TaxID=1204360 RepID=A0A0C5WIF7_9FLAO|nr:hypothetical protein AW14_12230 [Siansivirga zeaxanthinifaciens CC-SAMT-1]
MLLCPYLIFSQVGIKTTNPKAQLHIVASDSLLPLNTDGLIIPRIDEFPAVNPTIAQDGMLAYVTGAGSVSSGFYYWQQSIPAWVPFVKKIDDLLDGKSDNDGTDNGSSIFLGINSGAADDATDNKNIGIGFNSLESNTSGENNIGIGVNTLTNNTTGRNNTAVGSSALRNNTTGESNVAFGNLSLVKNIAGLNNVGFGNQTLRLNVYGNNNTALGDYAGKSLDFDSVTTNNNDNNVFVGSGAGNSDVTAQQNVYIGSLAGGGDYDAVNVSGTAENKSGNIFIGYRSGYDETGSNKLYIENSDNDSDNALIYGEFDNNILRTNGELQIGNPSTTGYAFPTADGTANQILVTDGNGQLSFQNNTPLSSFSLVRARMTASQTLVDGSQKLLFNTTDFDLNGEFDTATNSFIADNQGYYSISAKFSTDTQTNTTTYTLGIYVNGALYESFTQNHSGSGRVTRQIYAIVELSANDTVYIGVDTTATGAGTSVLNNNTRTTFTIERIRQIINFIKTKNPIHLNRIFFLF